MTDHYRLLAPRRRSRGGAGGAAAGRAAQGVASSSPTCKRRPGGVPATCSRRYAEPGLGGEVTNDTLASRCGLRRERPKEERRTRIWAPFRSRRVGPSGSEGRWSLIPTPGGTPGCAPQRWRRRCRPHGVVTREAVHAEEIARRIRCGVPGAQAMEGRCVRGAATCRGARGAQFAVPGAEEPPEQLPTRAPRAAHGGMLAANRSGESLRRDWSGHGGTEGTRAARRRRPGFCRRSRWSALGAARELQTFLRKRRRDGDAAAARAGDDGRAGGEGRRKAFLSRAWTARDVNASPLRRALKEAGSRLASRATESAPDWRVWRQKAVRGGER